MSNLLSALLRLLACASIILASSSHSLAASAGSWTSVPQALLEPLVGQPARPGAQPEARPRTQPGPPPRREPALAPAARPGDERPSTPREPGDAAAKVPWPRDPTPEEPPAKEPQAEEPQPKEPRAEEPRVNEKRPMLFKPGGGLETAPGAPGPAGIVPWVQTSFGSAKLLTLLQARMNVPLRGAREGWQTYRGHAPGGVEQNVAFQADRVRLILTGHFLTKNLEYMFQGDAVAAPFMLDAKLTYHLPWVKGLSVSFGRFLSTYSLIMSRLISRLETTEYPLFMSEGGYAPWRDFGLQIHYALPVASLGILNAYLGVFNGEIDSWTDTNDMKDFLLRVDFLGKGMLDGLWVGAYAWLGFPSCRSDAVDVTSATCIHDEFLRKKFDTDIRGGLFAEWQKPLGLVRPHVMVEGYLRKYTPRAAQGAEMFDFLSGGFWLHAGALLGKYVEPMARIEYIVASHKDDSIVNDWAVRLSAGAQVYFNAIHSHLKINYVFQYMGTGYSALASLTGGDRRFARPQWVDMEFERDALTGQLGLGPAKRSVHMFVVQAVTEF